MRDDLQRLQDMLEAVDRIERRADINRVAFDSDELIQTWMAHHLQIVGEAASRLSEELRSRHQDVPWAAISAMRNVIVHAYFRVDNDEVWSTVVRDIPPLKSKLSAVLAAEFPEEKPAGD